jgi:hypothetical protein
MPPILDEALAAVAALETGRKVDGSTLHPALRALFRPEVQGFLMDAFSYDPAQLISAVSEPVLILKGLSDLQVGEDDARRLSEHLHRVATHGYPFEVKQSGFVLVR